MKDGMKFLALLISGLFTAAFLYPLLHEAGHFLVGLLAGAEICRFSLWPVPMVAAKASSVGQIWIGLGGIFLPYLVAFLMRPRRFCLWYINFLLRGISVFSLLLSLGAILCDMNGIRWEEEDIIQVLQIFPQGRGLFLCLFTLMFAGGIYGLIKEKPLQKCMVYFGFPEQKEKQAG